ncbi:MAG: serine/threonine-protein kinase [Pirellulales bacterium]
MQLEQLGPYRLGKLLGKGGMGTVYEGVHVETAEEAAIKILSPGLAAEEGFRVRFEAEIESLKKLRHPNIVRLHGYGEQASTLFYAMELVHGTSLDDELRGGRRFDWREVTQIGIKLCRALKHAHDHGVIHRDLKPANVLLTSDGEVKLSDFGIARMFGNTRLTSDGGVLGTAEYMAPEQASGGTVTERADQYSLGGLMYSLLAGRAPFRAKTLVEMLQLQRYAEPEPVTRYAPQTPAELARIIHQLLEKDPQRRFSNTMILGRSLEAMERGLSISLSRGEDFVLSAPDLPPAAQSGCNPQTPTLSPTELGAILAGNEDEGASSDVQMTEATMAYGVEAPRPATPQAIAPAAQAPLPSDTSSGRFVKVDEQATPAQHDDGNPGWFSPQTWLLVTALVLLFAAGWYLMQPPSADRLYERIEAATADGELEQMKAALPDIKLFLQHYPADPRAEQVQALAEETQQNHPVQSAYTQAKRLAVLNSELAAEKFQALIDVYDDGEQSPEMVRHFVRLSRIKLKELHKQIARRTSEDRVVVESRLEKAISLAVANPPEARKIYDGIVTLYADKPWAASLVQQARAAVAEIDSAQAAVKD